MKLLFKALLLRRARDEGFTLPMVIALGLVMILLGAVNIVRSNEENLNAITQNTSSDAMAIAEVGVARYRELLNNNRVLTVYNLDQWNDANPSSQTCEDVTTTPAGWGDAGDSSKAVNDTTKWWQIAEDTDGDGTSDIDLDGDGTLDPAIGEYRIVDYQYDIDNDTTTNNDGQFAADDDNINTTDNFTFNNGPTYNTRGILTVQGRSLNGGGEAQIEVEIPLRINDMTNFAPALWIGSDSITNAGGTGDLNITDGNIILYEPGTGCDKPDDIDGDNVISDPRTLPAIVTLPTDSTKKNTLTDTTIDSYTLLPITSSDNKNDDERFYYEANGLTLNDKSLEPDGVAKVTLYLTGDIDINNTNSADDLNLGNYDPSNDNVSSHNLEIYGSDSMTAININPNGGTVNIEALIHAPDATVNIISDGTVNINGAVWVEQWNNSGDATVNIQTDETATTEGFKRSYKLYTTSENITPRPLTNSPTNWKREEVE
jgi:hypothetical protein